jgi:hypothetical protein
MTTYTEVKATLDEIAVRSERNRKRLLESRATLGQTEADLQTMVNQYSNFINAIIATATANPGDVAWQNAHAEALKLVGDFMVIQNRAQQLILAFDGV